MSLSLDLPQNVDTIVVSESSRHLVIVHTQMILLYPPESGQTSRINYLEHTSLLVLPLDVGGVPLTRVVQELLQEVPQQPTIGGGRLSGLSLRVSISVSGAARHLVG